MVSESVAISLLMKPLQRIHPDFPRMQALSHGFSRTYMGMHSHRSPCGQHHVRIDAVHAHAVSTLPLPDVRIGMSDTLSWYCGLRHLYVIFHLDSCKEYSALRAHPLKEAVPSHRGFSSRFCLCSPSRSHSRCCYRCHRAMTARRWMFIPSKWIVKGGRYGSPFGHVAMQKWDVISIIIATVMLRKRV